MPLLEPSSVGTVDRSDYPDGDPIMLASTRKRSVGGHADGTQPISDADNWVAALRRLWDNMVGKMAPDEGGCYAETCASIGTVMLAERLLCLAPDARYADVMELCCNYHNLLRQFLPSSPIPSHPLTEPHLHLCSTLYAHSHPLEEKDSTALV
ncbi:hypothetical protein VSDG_09518 [Cytospora chrysosperma]|uniref:Non-reducing end beta-L-arabinofuranosidase-like GH127 catalytic domain-containing protein n=1 Tax=Cytospora chrysosperma TaxID=252740 RepID=A0A423VD72_CYTCH|nr:hypothetical protein VSDG_09518 [Valsa sordida]